jgi:CheY-like chemotaxis protein
MKPSILVVDDDVAVRELLSALLADEGYRVRAAGDAYEALDAVSAASPDLLLVDLMMPGVSGAEFLARLRRDNRWAALPVILISAHPRLRDMAQELGAQAALAKPFDLSRLLEWVERVVASPHEVPG